MASLRSIVVVMVATTTLFTLSGAALCPPSDVKLVYPYWSECWKPALYYGEEVYEIAAGPGLSLDGLDVFGSLAPEYDESNSTYYMRLAEVGAKYKLTHLTKEYRFFVMQNENLMFVNVDTGRALAWRQEGEDEYFLVEIETDTTGAAFFRFSAANVWLICPRSMSARCEAYYILTSTISSLGWSPYAEEGAIYIKRGNNTGIPFVLLRTAYTESATNSKLAALA